MAQQIKGYQEALRELGRIDKTLQKKYKQRASDILAPGVDAVKASFPTEALSGMKRSWKVRKGAVQLGKYNAGRVKRSVKVRIYMSKRARTSIALVISSPIANVIEFAGTDNPMGQNLTNKFRRPARFAWPAFTAKKPMIEAQLASATYDAAQEINRRLAK